MMPARWKAVPYFAFSLPDRPGALAELTESLRAAKISLSGLWGYSDEGQAARFSCVPDSPAKFRAFARKAKLKAEEGKTFFTSGVDRLGALVNTLDRIAAAGINLHGIDAVALGTKFGCFLWADEKDWTKLGRMLK